MKKFSQLIISILFLFISCKESTTEPGNNSDPINEKFYVIKDGASFHYALIVTDTNNISFNGNRYVSFDNSAIIGGTEYFVQIDSFETFVPFDTLTTSVISFIRGTNTGVFSYADTTGFTGFIPDTLRQYLTVDRESRLLFYPLSVGQDFPVFTLSLSQFIIGINVLDVDAKVETAENLIINVNNISTSFATFKIKYTFIVRPSSTIEFTYTAYGWTVKDIGFVKWEGDSEVFNFLFNENIFPPSTTINMSLKEFQI